MPFPGRRKVLKPRPPMKLWTCPLCERFVTAVNVWRDPGERGMTGVIYFHGDKERHFVANQSVAGVVSQIGEIAIPRENTFDGGTDDQKPQDHADRVDPERHVALGPAREPGYSGP